MKQARLASPIKHSIGISSIKHKIDWEKEKQQQQLISNVFWFPSSTNSNSLEWFLFAVVLMREICDLRVFVHLSFRKLYKNGCSLLSFGFWFLLLVMLFSQLIYELIINRIGILNCKFMVDLNPECLFNAYKVPYSRKRVRCSIVKYSQVCFFFLGIGTTNWLTNPVQSVCIKSHSFAFVWPIIRASFHLLFFCDFGLNFMAFNFDSMRSPQGSQNNICLWKNIFLESRTS